jgi:aspartate/methionine/tyrosine aminotransferase
MFSDRTAWNRAENELTRTLERLRAAGAPVFDLTRSNPTECGFAHDETKVAKALAATGITHYAPDAKGLAIARTAICGYYRDQCRVSMSIEDLLLTAGTSEAYSFLFRLLCNTGDEVLIPAPGYPLFDFLAEVSDVNLVRFPLIYEHGWQIDFLALARAATERTRALIVVHPNNPTGHYVSSRERQRLAEFSAERGIALIVDEVFLDFSLQVGEPVKTFADSTNVLTFTLSGLSKICGMPQMKLAWLALSGPEAQKREAMARLEIIADAYLSVGTPVQMAAPALLEMRGEFHRRLMERVRANVAELDRQLAGQTACTRLGCEAGWTAVLRVPALQSDEELAIALLKDRGVYVHPGHFYDFARPAYLVISLIVPQEDFAEGMRRVLAHCA